MIQSTLRCSMSQPMAKLVYVFSEKSRVIKVFKLTYVIRKFWDSNSWSSVLGTSCLYVYNYQNNFLRFSRSWLGGTFFVSSFYVKFQCGDFLIFSFNFHLAPQGSFIGRTSPDCDRTFEVSAGDCEVFFFL